MILISMKKITKNSNRVKLESLVESQFRKLVRDNFKGLYEYCFQTGSFAFGGGTVGKSDLDVVIIFKDCIYALPKRELYKKIEFFTNGYLKLHRQTGYLPDLAFPGEFITVSQVNDSINGRGFHLDLKGNLYLPKASTQYYLENPERWFRAWLSQSAFNKFLLGNEKLYKENKVKAWSSILKFTLWNEKIDSFTPLNLFNQLRPFGVHADYYNFKILEGEWVTKSLELLADQGFVSKKGNVYTADHQKLMKWEKDWPLLSLHLQGRARPLWSKK